MMYVYVLFSIEMWFPKYAKSSTPERDNLQRRTSPCSQPECCSTRRITMDQRTAVFALFLEAPHEVPAKLQSLLQPSSINGTLPKQFWDELHVLIGQKNGGTLTVEDCGDCLSDLLKRYGIEEDDRYDECLRTAYKTRNSPQVDN
jgi:hypothetical protein